MTRPAVATILGVVNLLFGLWGVAWGLLNLGFLLLLSSGASAAMSGNSPLAALTSQDGMTYALNAASASASALLSVLLLVAGVGLLMTRNWGRSFALGASALALVYFLAFDIAATLLSAGATRRMVEGSMGAEFSDGFLYFLVVASILFAAVFRLFYPLLQIYFLSRPDVRRAYGVQG